MLVEGVGVAYSVRETVFDFYNFPVRGGCGGIVYLVVGIAVDYVFFYCWKPRVYPVMPYRFLERSTPSVLH